MVLKTGGASPLLLKKVVLQLSLKKIHRAPSYRVGQASELTYKSRSPAQHLSFSKVPAVVVYCEPLITKEIGYHRLSATNSSIIQKQKLHRLKDQLRKDLLNLAEIEEQMEHVESEMENHSKDKGDVRIIRKGMLNALERTLRKQAIGIVKEEKEIE